MDEALDIASQIAEALQEAHEQGNVHRDLLAAKHQANAGRQSESVGLRAREGIC